MKNQYITDAKGRKTGVILHIRDYKKIMEKVEELEDIKAYDEAINSDEEAIPAKKVFQELEKRRRESRS